MSKTPANEPKRWLDEKSNIDKLYYALVAVCVGLVVADFAYHKHGHFDFEQWYGFHFFYGFAVFAFVVFVGTNLRKVLMRDEDYYAPEREPTPGGTQRGEAGEGKAHG